MLYTISIFVKGKVQGVFFRQSTCEMAMAIGINGHVKNLSDGRVGIVATGTMEQLDKLVAWCRVGPPDAIVTSIETDQKPLQHFDEFRIER